MNHVSTSVNGPRSLTCPVAGKRSGELMNEKHRRASYETTLHHWRWRGNWRDAKGNLISVRISYALMHLRFLTLLLSHYIGTPVYTRISAWGIPWQQIRRLVQCCCYSCCSSFGVATQGATECTYKHWGCLCTWLINNGGHNIKGANGLPLRNNGKQSDYW